MTDGIGRIFGGNNYGVGGYIRQQQNENDKNPDLNQAPAVAQEAQVDPERVMDFLAANNFFVAPTTNAGEVQTVDAATEQRISGYMENFEFIYGIVAEEFGEELAPNVMDFVMDYLMDLAA